MNSIITQGPLEGAPIPAAQGFGVELWSELIVNAPYMGVLGFLVFKAMGYLKERDTAMMIHEEKRDDQMMKFINARDVAFQDAISHIGDDCHTVQRDATEAMKDNTRVLGRVEAVTERFEKRLEKL